MNAMLMTRLKVIRMQLVIAGLIGTAGVTYQAQAAAQPTAPSATQTADKQVQPTTPNDQKSPGLGGSVLTAEDLRGKWKGEKNRIKVELTFKGDKAQWQVEFVKSRKPKLPGQSPKVAVGIGANLRCIPDRKAGRLKLYLPSYLGNDKEIKKYPARTGRTAVGEIMRGTEGTMQLRIIPTGYERLEAEDYDYPAIEGLILRRTAEVPK